MSGCESSPGGQRVWIKRILDIGNRAIRLKRTGVQLRGSRIPEHVDPTAEIVVGDASRRTPGKDKIA